MKTPTMYASGGEPDHIDRLYQIAHLAKIGAASTDTVMVLERMGDSHQSLFEVIHRLASEAAEIAQGQEND